MKFLPGKNVALAAALVALSSIVLSGLPGPKTRVVATIFPLFEFVRAVGGDRIEADLLVPAGADIHSWQPRFGDIKKMAGAGGLFLYLGADLEPWADDLIRNAAGPGWTVLEASRGLDLIEDADEAPQGAHGADPHVWLDFAQDQIIIDRIASALTDFSPEEAPYFRASAEAYKAKLEALDRRYREALGSCRGRRLLIGGHAAFAYLVRRYGFVQTAVTGPTPEAVPAPREMVRLVSLAKAEKITTVFFDPSSGDRLARILAAEIGARIRPLHPGHNLAVKAAVPTAFLDLMDQNLENLRHGLGCR